MNREQATEAFLRGDVLEGMDEAREDDERGDEDCDCGVCHLCDDSDPGERR